MTAPTTAQALPDSDGWIEHDGSPCPIDGASKVQVKFRDGNISSSNRTAEWWDGSDSCWRHFGTDADIIAYRVVQS